MAKKKISKEELQKTYYENDIIPAAEILGISVSTMYTYIRKAKIKMKGAGRKKGQTKIIIKD
jgi:transposase